MREIRTSGSEGGGTVNPSFLPLSCSQQVPRSAGVEPTLAEISLTLRYTRLSCTIVGRIRRCGFQAWR
jgi:hypothetical protein